MARSSARDELLEVAELLGAPIVKALLGKAVVPDDHPLTTGGIGLLGTRPSQEAFEECDTLLIVGSTFPYIEYYPKPGQARGVQIDRDRIAHRPAISRWKSGSSAMRARRCAMLAQAAQGAWRPEHSSSARSDASATWNTPARTIRPTTAPGG